MIFDEKFMPFIALFIVALVLPVPGWIYLLLLVPCVMAAMPALWYLYSKWRSKSQ